ncbi:MAG: sugar phosphate nucleotidyltransferase [Candidatus Omnitrophota bacterium]
MSIPTVGIIMAGGSGERFWPISRRLRPKQLLRLTSETKTMLEEAVDRLAPLIPPERIFIGANADLQAVIRSALPQIPAENVLGEPMRRNTSGCIAFAAAHALARFPDAEDILMSVTTADHRIGDNGRFRSTLAAALRWAEENEALVAIGTHPTRPETGFGYIQIAELNKPVTESGGVPIYRAAQFLEKPHQEDAERYQASRFYYWNSGMFFWRISTFLKSLQRALPDLAQSVLRMAEILQRNTGAEKEIAEIFERMPNISIDYGLMEKAENVYVALGDFAWDDAGAWDSLARFQSRDSNRNTVYGGAALVDCRNVIVYNEPGMEKMAVGAAGMENAIIAVTEDGVLVCRRDRAQDVRLIVEELKNRGATQI